MRRFLAEPGVLLYDPSLKPMDFRGVACMCVDSSWIALDGEFTPSSSRRSKRPRTCPSFCGVGPIASFVEGEKSFLKTEGESYGSTSHGRVELVGVLLDGVCESWRILDAWPFCGVCESWRRFDA